MQAATAPKAGKQGACQEARRYGCAPTRQVTRGSATTRYHHSCITPAGHPPLLRCQDKIPQHIQGVGKTSRSTERINSLCITWTEEERTSFSKTSYTITARALQLQVGRYLCMYLKAAGAKHNSLRIVWKEEKKKGESNTEQNLRM